MEKTRAARTAVQTVAVKVVQKAEKLVGLMGYQLVDTMGLCWVLH
jgi:hypothetical protein